MTRILTKIIAVSFIMVMIASSSYYFLTDTDINFIPVYDEYDVLNFGSYDDLILIYKQIMIHTIKIIFPPNLVLQQVYEPNHQMEYLMKPKDQVIQRMIIQKQIFKS